jgi:hypothetical protein
MLAVILYERIAPSITNERTAELPKFGRPFRLLSIFVLLPPWALQYFDARASFGDKKLAADSRG